MTDPSQASDLGRIQAKSEKQAMEWSLVLASQGYAPVIHHEPDSDGWELLLPRAEIAGALGHLKIYRLENRHWPWQQPVLDYGLLFDWGCLGWLAVVVMFHMLSSAAPEIKTAGRMDASLVSGGEWWRLFTATWLHGDAAHLASNVSLGVPLLGLVMGRYGTGLGFLAAVLAGAAGNLFAVVVAPHPHLSLGASGVVMSCLGLLAVQSLPEIKSHKLGARYLWGGLFGGIMLFVLLGLSPGSDVTAHLGGFLAGLLLGVPLSRLGRPNRHRGADLAAGALAALLIMVPWWLAFRS